MKVFVTVYVLGLAVTAANALPRGQTVVEAFAPVEQTTTKPLTPEQLPEDEVKEVMPEGEVQEEDGDMDEETRVIFTDLRRRLEEDIRNFNHDLVLIQTLLGHRPRTPPVITSLWDIWKFDQPQNTTDEDQDIFISPNFGFGGVFDERPQFGFGDVFNGYEDHDFGGAFGGHDNHHFGGHEDGAAIGFGDFLDGPFTGTFSGGEGPGFGFSAVFGGDDGHDLGYGGGFGGDDDHDLGFGGVLGSDGDTGFNNGGGIFDINPIFSNVPFPVFPNPEELPDDYHNETHQVHDINGTRVVVNSTTNKEVEDGFSSFFHHQVIHFGPGGDKEVEVEVEEEEEKEVTTPQGEAEVDEATRQPVLPEVDNEASASDLPEDFNNEVLEEWAPAPLLVRSLDYRPIVFPNDDPATFHNLPIRPSTVPKPQAPNAPLSAPYIAYNEDADYLNLEYVPPPDLSGDTAVNFSHGDRQGLVMIEPDAEVLDYDKVVDYTNNLEFS